MAKKSTRIRKARRQAAQAQITTEEVEETAAVVAEEVAPAPARPTRRSPRQRTTESLEEEYSYVVNDLRRVFILAGIMFALLILVNLGLRFLV